MVILTSSQKQITHVCYKRLTSNWHLLIQSVQIIYGQVSRMSGGRIRRVGDSQATQQQKVTSGGNPIRIDWTHFNPGNQMMLVTTDLFNDVSGDDSIFSLLSYHAVVTEDVE